MSRSIFSKAMRYTMVTMAAAMILNVPVYAGQWRKTKKEEWQYEEQGRLVTGWNQVEGHWRYFDEKGTMQVGWIKDPTDKLWYDLDGISGIWIEHPLLNSESVTKLLENACVKAHLYQNETGIVDYKVVSERKESVTVRVGVISGPQNYRKLNEFCVDWETGEAKGNQNVSVQILDNGWN